MSKRDELSKKLLPLRDPRVIEVLVQLHRESARQDARLVRRFLGQLPRLLTRRKLDWAKVGPQLSSLYLAVDPDNGLLCYLLLRALNARRVIEFGTSMGVSTIYLAAAVRDNGGGKVVATELIPDKAACARRNLRDAGLLEFVDLREGDATRTLAGEREPIDFLLNDGFPPLTLPILKHVAPLMRTGAIALCGNVVLFPADHEEYIQWVRDPANGFFSVRLPMKFAGEISVKGENVVTG